MHRAKAKENSPSGENDLHPRSAFGERWDLIGGKIGAKARAADGVAPEEVIPALLLGVWAERSEDLLIYFNSGGLLFL